MPLHMVKTFKLSVKVESFLVHSEFVVCYSLAAPFIVGIYVYDRFVEAILPRKKAVQMDDGSTVRIVKRPRKQPSAPPPFPSEQGYDSSEERLRTAFRATETSSVA